MSSSIHRFSKDLLDREICRDIQVNGNILVGDIFGIMTVNHYKDYARVHIIVPFLPLWQDSSVFEDFQLIPPCYLLVEETSTRTLLSKKHE